MTVQIVLALYCCICASLTAGICLQAEFIGRNTKLLSFPDGVQRLHKRPMPLVGGLSVVAPIILILLAYSKLVPTELAAAELLAGMMMFAVGVLDDRFGISAGGRLFGIAIIACGALLIAAPLTLHNLNLSLLGTAVSLSLGSWALTTTCIILVGFVNAGNMADGINGQCLGSVLIWSMLMLPYLGSQDAALFLFLASSVSVALIFNLRDRLFCGSGGAYAFSLLVALGSLSAYQNLGQTHAELQVLWFWLPTLDCLRLMVVRFFEHRKPFAGDRNHIHHLLLDVCSPSAALAIYLGFLALPGALVWISEIWGETALVIEVLLYVGFVGWRTQKRRASCSSILAAPAEPAPDRLSVKASR